MWERIGSKMMRVRVGSKYNYDSNQTGFDQSGAANLVKRETWVPEFNPRAHSNLLHCFQLSRSRDIQGVLGTVIIRVEGKRLGRNITMTRLELDLDRSRAHTDSPKATRRAKLYVNQSCKYYQYSGLSSIERSLIIRRSCLNRVYSPCSMIIAIPIES